MRYIDLYAGVGEASFAFPNSECVYAAEWDVACQESYIANHDMTYPLVGDVAKIEYSELPEYDVLIAAFPCQPFSIAAQATLTWLNKPKGTEAIEGQAIFDIACIISATKPKAFLFENVPNFLTIQKGMVWHTFKTVLEELGYVIQYRIINALPWVPQSRKRVFIVGSRRQVNMDIHIPKTSPRLRDILEDNVDDKYTLSDESWTRAIAKRNTHGQKGTSFGYTLVDLDSYAPTLTAHYAKDAHSILIPQMRNNPRKLTPRECARLMGFSDEYKIVVSNYQAYRQLGNSIVVPLLAEFENILQSEV